MHPQSTPTYEIRFDGDAVPALTTAAPVGPLELGARIAGHLTDAGRPAVRVDVHLAAGRVTATDAAGTITGRITGPGVGTSAAADLTAVTELLTAGGWVLDDTTALADDSIEHTYLHPSGGAVTAQAHPGGLVDLTMTGLTLEQVASAVTGAGLAPTPTPEPTERALRQHPAADLIRLKTAIGAMAIRYGDSRADYILAVLQSGNDDAKSRLRRAQGRRHAALIRLTRALADLAAKGSDR